MTSFTTGKGASLPASPATRSNALSVAEKPSIGPRRSWPALQPRCGVQLGAHASAMANTELCAGGAGQEPTKAPLTAPGAGAGEGSRAPFELSRQFA